MQLEYNYDNELLELRRELKKKADEADHSVMRVGLSHWCCYDSSIMMGDLLICDAGLRVSPFL
jgi:hypothetical protein